MDATRTHAPNFSNPRGALTFAGALAADHWPKALLLALVFLLLPALPVAGADDSPQADPQASEDGADRAISCENHLHADDSAPYAIFPCGGQLDFWWINANDRGQKQFSVPQVSALIQSDRAGGPLIQTTHPGNGRLVVVSWLSEAQEIEVSTYYTDKPDQVDRPYIIRIDRNLQVARVAAASATAVRGLTRCMVTTTHNLNFRAAPAGDIQGTVPYDVTRTAMARTDDWFQVKYHGATGWISADYVIAAGDCG